MASAYCTGSDLYSHGLPRGGLPNPGRIVAAVDSATDTLTLDGHGFAADAALLFRADAGGTMPGGLTSGAAYYAIPVTDSTFKVAATPGGAAVNITSAGSNVIVVAELPIDEAIEFASAMIDDMLPAHVVPVEAPYPVSIVAATATLATGRLLSYVGSAPGTLTTAIADAKALLKDWVRGRPLRGANVPPSANLAMVSRPGTSTAVLP